jgi:23S rRNA pseudouridine1911/1915/1917 synthase
MPAIKLQEIFTPLQQSGTRLDKLLAQNFVQIPRETFRKEILKGNILVNKKKVKPNYVTEEHDEIKVDIFIEELQKEALPDSSVEINIVYNHPDFLIIEKPAGISVHPSEKEPTGTLANGLLEKFPEIKDVGENPMRPGIVHRLDKYTSGLLLVPKNQNAFVFFKDLFKNRKIIKRYTAVCWGAFANQTGVIDLMIGRSKSNPLRQSASKSASKLGNAKDALTKYKILETSTDKRKSLILAMPKTGRKHQIRVHLHSIGHPIVGDKMYELAINKQENKPFERFLLHASYLEFTFLDGKKYVFDSPVPAEFLEGF